ncbi:MAG TPA: 23S rRNA (pseudouridine(1915)-N(3))-methyltransferase RlmH [Terriglobales bacterium]|nr:23S rRNA (pseudouridine(1915)-N(3))-methyltransferase RlmH [Terriglobales bacterium]
MIKSRAVKLRVAWIGKTKDPAIQSLTADYLKRLTYYADAEGLAFPSEEGLLRMGQRVGNRPAHSLIILDSRGKELSSEEFAKFLQDYQNTNPQPLLFGIGGSDGFSTHARRSAYSLLSLGKMTLAHELARIVLLEQLYRAFTILKGHPYHLGH